MKKKKTFKVPEGFCPEGQVAVLLEDLHGKIDLLAEGQSSLERRMEQRMSRLEQRMDRLEREVYTQMTAFAKGLDAVMGEIQEIKEMLKGKADKEQVDRLEERVEKLERTVFAPVKREVKIG